MSRETRAQIEFTKGCLALIAGAGLAGAVGVALAAVAAHRIESPVLATASSMLMIHAGTVVAIAILAAVLPNRGFVWVGALQLAAVFLFSSAVAAPVLAGIYLFPYAAPIGGSLTILSWLCVAGCAVVAMFRTGRN